MTKGGLYMTINIFLWSVFAGIIATVIVGSTYKFTNKNKTKKTIKQKGENNTAIMDSWVNINSDKNKGD